MNRILPQYSTVTFTQVWDEVEDFMQDFHNNGLFDTTTQPLTDATAQTLYYLLYARFGNNPIANRDINQWKYKMFSVILQYGPTWAKKMEVQKALRELSIDDLREGTEAVHNAAFNPETAPSTDDYDPLPFINQQNATKYKKNKLDGYALLVALLEDDLTYKFLNKFQHCFKQFVAPEEPLLFVTEEDED